MSLLETQQREILDGSSDDISDYMQLFSLPM